MNIEKAYKRFKHYHDMYGSVYVYVDYESDLKEILDFVGEKLQTPKEQFDCTWGNPEGEDE